MRTIILIALFLLPNLVVSTTLNMSKKPLNQFLVMMSDIIKKPIIVNSQVDIDITTFANSDIEPKKLLYAVLEANELDYEETENYILIRQKHAFSQYDDFQTVIYDFNNVLVEDVIEPLNSALDMLSLEYSFTRTSFKAHPANNGTSLILSAPKSAISHINNLLQVYDKPKKQVRFNLAIVETTDSDLFELGLAFVNDKGKDKVSGSFSNNSQGGLSWIRSVGDFTSFLSFLDSNSTSRIVSKPTLTMISGKSARISVGQNIPILTGQKSSQIDGDSTFQEIERIDIGLILDIQAIVTQGGLINVKLDQELSSLSRDAEAIDVITDKRFVSSEFQMHDKQSFKIGGLISTKNDDIESGIPLLKELPWVGKAFQSTSNQNTVRNLTIVLFAEII